jgi:hypothetical protein
MYQARKVISVCTLITFLAWYMYFKIKGKINIHTDHFPVCVSILTFLLKYMYQARKVISVCIDLALFIEVYVPSQENDFLVWYMYFNKKRQDQYTH